MACVTLGRGTVLSLLAGSLLIGGSADARRLADSGTPKSVERMLACRAIGDAAARLSCFDLESKGIAAAIATRDLVVIDRERAKVAGRAMFGFSIPNFGGLLGTGGEISSINQKVTSASRNPFGGWLIRLDDGSLWNQTDDSMLGLAPRVGDAVTVRRGALGSFVVSVRGQPGFKAVRIG